MILIIVALFTRAWIEIFLSVPASAVIASPSLRGRGLKYAAMEAFNAGLASPSLRGRGLK